MITVPDSCFASMPVISFSSAMIEAYSVPCAPARSASTGPALAPCATATGIDIAASLPAGTSMAPVAVCPRAAFAVPTVNTARSPGFDCAQTVIAGCAVNKAAANTAMRVVIMTFLLRSRAAASTSYTAMPTLVDRLNDRTSGEWIGIVRNRSRYLSCSSAAGRRSPARRLIPRPVPPSGASQKSASPWSRRRTARQISAIRPRTPPSLATRARSTCSQ